MLGDFYGVLFLSRPLLTVPVLCDSRIDIGVSLLLPPRPDRYFDWAVITDNIQVALILSPAVAGLTGLLYSSSDFSESEQHDRHSR